MTDPKETSPKHKVRSREPKKATAAGIFDNLRKLPHPVEEILGLTVLGAQNSLTHPNPSQPIPTYPNLSQPIPAQFQKRSSKLIEKQHLAETSIVALIALSVMLYPPGCFRVRVKSFMTRCT